MDPSPALVLFFPPTTTAADRDRLVALLSDFGLVAIHEDDVVWPTQWTAHFTDGSSRDAASTAMHESVEYPDVRVEPVDLADEDWARRTQADLPAIRIGRVIIAPPWDLPGAATAENGRQARDAGDTSDLVVVIEPSRGFGTGHHQSTRLCLALLQTRTLRGRTVIDAGTGSGVLAIAAAGLGAEYAFAFDVDPDAIENARENAARNGVEAVVEAHVADLSALSLPSADVVAANLTGSLLARHAADLTALVKPGGVLIASGFTVDECERVRTAFAPGMSVAETAEEDGWWAFVLVARTLGF